MIEAIESIHSVVPLATIFAGGVLPDDQTGGVNAGGGRLDPAAVNFTGDELRTSNFEQGA